MTYAVIFTRNDGWTGVTTIEAIQPTYDKAMVEAEKQVKDIMKTQHLKGSVQDNIKNGEIELDDIDPEFIQKNLYQEKKHTLIKEIIMEFFYFVDFKIVF